MKPVLIFCLLASLSLASVNLKLIDFVNLSRHFGFCWWENFFAHASTAISFFLSPFLFMFCKTQKKMSAAVPKPTIKFYDALEKTYSNTESGAIIHVVPDLTTTLVSSIVGDVVTVERVGNAIMIAFRYLDVLITFNLEIKHERDIDVMMKELSGLRAVNIGEVITGTLNAVHKLHFSMTAMEKYSTNPYIITKKISCEIYDF